jgi:uncharacterized protein
VSAKVVVWRRLDVPGHEFARLANDGSIWELAGTAVFFYEKQPCKLDYRVVCSSDWHTQTAQVSGWLGEQRIDTDIRVEAGGQRWWLNGVEQPQVAGCIDVDLNFSPVTNTLPIRRLNLSAGQAGPVKAAWLRFPGFTLQPLEQVYRRMDENVYRYQSGESFRADLNVDRDGLVRNYPGAWRMENSDR